MYPSPLNCIVVPGSGLLATTASLTASGLLSDFLEVDRQREASHGCAVAIGDLQDLTGIVLPILKLLR